MVKHEAVVLCVYQSMLENRLLSALATCLIIKSEIDLVLAAAE